MKPTASVSPPTPAHPLPRARGCIQLAILSPKAVVPAVAGYLIEHYEAVGSEDGHPHLGYVVTFVVAASLVGLGGLTGLFLSRSRVDHVHRDEDLD